HFYSYGLNKKSKKLVLPFIKTKFEEMTLFSTKEINKYKLCSYNLQVEIERDSYEHLVSS
ncbi:1067_t:CDS:1, partial [Gigaspora margarita]